MSKVETSSGNVYDDLGFPEAKAMQAKAQLVALMCQAIEAKRMSLDHVAKALGTTKNELDRLLTGHFQAFSLDDLERTQKEIQECTKI
ncbi:XRE family transcriptional regulator [Pseudomonas sp. BF-RE-26]|uniref:XRE family transcriptional regulator n=1 Tax=Pseudomonas sp. BF-RE-26 TaxID=2832396 RepID=UPI001CBCBD5B|nr:XRE family transcriptional regulator [Pseudomonas sp. BF-RE-26]